MKNMFLLFCCLTVGAVLAQDKTPLCPPDQAKAEAPGKPDRPFKGPHDAGHWGENRRGPMDRNNLPGGPGGRMMPRRRIDYGNWLGAMVVSEKFIKEIGISDEQVSKLKTALAQFDEEGRKLEEEIRQNARQQAEKCRELLGKPGDDAGEVLAIVEKIGKLRTEQAKISIKTLMTIRDTLNDEQREKALAFIRSEGARRMNERRNFNHGGRENPAGKPEPMPAEPQK